MLRFGKKVVLALLIALVAVGMVFAGGDEEKSSVNSKLPHKTIAVIYSSFTDELGSQFKASLESLSSAFNVEFKFVETGFNQEQGQALIDSVFQTSIDALISVTPAVSNLESAKKAGNIPVVSLNAATDLEQAALIASYNNYVGAVINDDYILGYNAAYALYNAGCRKICIASLTPALSKNHDDRLKGFNTALKELPEMVVLAENSSRAQWSKAIETFSAAFPEMDGMFLTACNESAYQAIKKAGLVGKIKIATADISESTPDYLANGTIVSIAGGQYNKIMLAFAALYNYIYDGTRVIKNADNAVYTPMLQVKSVEDYEVYSKYISLDAGRFVYAPEDIMNMINGIVGNITPEKFEQICNSYSMEDIIARMSK